MIIFMSILLFFIIVIRFRNYYVTAPVDECKSNDPLEINVFRAVWALVMSVFSTLGAIAVSLLISLLIFIFI